MAASLATQYYQLGKYAPNDLTDYLTTYNGTMDKIDAGIHAAQDAADTAQAQADANLNNIGALSQNLTAANKNIENLGKVQTAQQAEIDNISSLAHGEITLTTGEVFSDSNQLSKKNGIVTMNYQIHNLTSVPSHTITQLGLLPAGFAPSNTIAINIFYGTNRVTFFIGSDRKISIQTTVDLADNPIFSLNGSWTV